MSQCPTYLQRVVSYKANPLPVALLSVINEDVLSIVSFIIFLHPLPADLLSTLVMGQNENKSTRLPPILIILLQRANLGVLGRVLCSEDGGCNYMDCPNCRRHFCWSCGWESPRNSWTHGLQPQRMHVFCILYTWFCLRSCAFFLALTKRPFRVYCCFCLIVCAWGDS